MSIPATAENNTAKASEEVRCQVNGRPEVVQREPQHEVTRQDTRRHIISATGHLDGSEPLHKSHFMGS